MQNPCAGSLSRPFGDPSRLEDSKSRTPVVGEEGPPGIAAKVCRDRLPATQIQKDLVARGAIDPIGQLPGMGFTPWPGKQLNGRLRRAPELSPVRRGEDAKTRIGPARPDVGLPDVGVAALGHQGLLEKDQLPVRQELRRPEELGHRDAPDGFGAADPVQLHLAGLAGNVALKHRHEKARSIGAEVDQPEAREVDGLDQ